MPIAVHQQVTLLIKLQVVAIEVDSPEKQQPQGAEQPKKSSWASIRGAVSKGTPFLRLCLHALALMTLFCRCFQRTLPARVFFQG